ncbi:alpha/beta hydrolase [Bacillus sp. AFS077874]|uniref:alpha/beta fold hydrolase n=1 Tax=Bacillus sp. AFS077874 TaxID=2033513 RepID=UPI000BF7F5D9|nr:alpha/beta hydrolase [Bacillus sp. AFS077874]PFM75247.1 alpha/beta hydrolase [Bacillus sp. AFS077874]
MNNAIIPEIGNTLDIGGIELYYEYFGKNTGNPTIIFESGYGCPLTYWNSIREEVSNLTNVFMYNRSGIMNSTKDERHRHSQQNIENLRILLRKANIMPPYVFVGHSFGGINVRLYASSYPEEVVGVILLDPSHEDQHKKMVHLFKKEVQEDYYKGFEDKKSLSDFEESFEQVRCSEFPNNIPLTVLTGGKQPHHSPESMSVWMEFQQNIAKLSKNSKHLILEDCGHAVHIDQPEIVTREIQNMLEKINIDK